MVRDWAMDSNSQRGQAVQNKSGWDCFNGRRDESRNLLPIWDMVVTGSVDGLAGRR